MLPMSKVEKELIPLRDVELRLVLPTTKATLTRRSMENRLEKLGIKPVMQKVNAVGWAVAHVTNAEAVLIEEDFKRTHWRKFKAAEKKP